MKQSKMNLNSLQSNTVIRSAILSFALVAPLLLASTGFCQPPDETEKSAGQAAAAGTGAQPPAKSRGLRARLRYELSKEWRDQHAIAPNALFLLQEGEYVKLEKMASEFRQSKEAFSNGEWKLTEFYNGVSKIEKGDTGDEKMESLKEWAADNPQSITARVALAQGWVNYAWVARGSGFSDSVSSAGDALFRERLAQGRLVLREAKAMPLKCPHWWAVAQRIALGQGWDRKTYEGLYQEAIKFEPEYFPYYVGKSYYLLQRWYGDSGEPELFAAEAADALAKVKGPIAGDILYARLIWSLDFGRYGEINLAEPNVSARRVQSGFAELSKRYPDNLAVLSEWARLSNITGNTGDAPQRKAKARELFGKINNTIDPWVFHTEEEFVASRDKALAE